MIERTIKTSLFVGTAEAQVGDDWLRATATVQKYCESNATDIHGHTWAVAAWTDRFVVRMGEVDLVITDLQLSFVGREVGSEAESVLSFSGVVEGTVGIEATPGAIAAGGDAWSLSLAGELRVVDNQIESVFVYAKLDYVSEAKHEFRRDDYDGANSTATMMKPELAIHASATFQYPCDAGDTFVANATVDVYQMGGPDGLTVDEMTASIIFYCGILPDGKFMMLSASTGERGISVGGLNFGALDFTATLYNKVATKNGPDVKSGAAGSIKSQSKEIQSHITFDTRVGTFTASGSYNYEDENVKLTMKGSYNNDAACVDTGFALQGTLDFKKVEGLVFDASVNYYCKPDSENVYSVSALMERLEVIPMFSLADVSIDAVGKRIAEGADDAKWYATVKGTVRFDVDDDQTGVVDGLTTSIRLTATADVDFKRGFQDVSVKGVVDIHLPNVFSIVGVMTASTKECRASNGGAINAGLTLNLDLDGTLVIRDAHVAAAFHCGRPAVEDYTKTMTFTAGVDIVSIADGVFAVKDVHLEVEILEWDASQITIPFLWDTSGTGVKSSAATLGLPTTQQGERQQIVVKGRFEGFVDIMSAFNGPIFSASLGFTTKGEGEVTMTVGMSWFIDFGNSTSLDIQANGTMNIPCNELGDVTMQASATLVTGIEWLPKIEGEARFRSDCGDKWDVSMRAQMHGEVEVLEGIILKMPGDVQVDALSHTPGVYKFRVVFTPFVDLPKVTFFFGTVIKPDDEVMYDLGVHIRRMTLGELFGTVDRIAPGRGVANMNPMDSDAASGRDEDEKAQEDASKTSAIGAVRHALRNGHVELTPEAESAVASLGGKVDTLTNSILEYVLPEIYITLTITPRGLYIAISIQDLDLFGLGFDIVVLVAENNGVWNCMVYVGFADIKDGKLVFPDDWKPLGDFLNVPLGMVGSGTTHFGLRFSTVRVVHTFTT